MQKIFITGIDTNVGKTIVSAIFVEALKADYWKPIQAGLSTETDTEKVKNLVSNTQSRFHPDTFRLTSPLSPHAAAKIDNINIEISKITLPQTQNTLIIEGIGGLLVPLNNKELLIDLIKELNAEVVLVIKNYLGSINHALLSLEALQRRNIKIKGLVFRSTPLPYSEEIISLQSGLNTILKLEEEKEINKRVILKYAQRLDNV